jgi:hypothetical protein
LLELVDSAHSTVTEADTLQGYADELVARSGRPIETWSFSHDVTHHPFIGAFNAGDFAEVRVTDSRYVDPGAHRMRLVGRSGSLGSKTVDLQFQPEVS